jgi:hypothetical protein
MNCTGKMLCAGRVSWRGLETTGGVVTAAQSSWAVVWIMLVTFALVPVSFRLKGTEFVFWSMKRTFQVPAFKVEMATTPEGVLLTLKHVEPGRVK